MCGYLCFNCKTACAHFSNMLFEMNENPKVIQQLLGHRDVKTTIGIYNSVNSDYVKEATDKLNERIVEDEMNRKREEKEKKEKEEQEILRCKKFYHYLILF